MLDDLIEQGKLRGLIECLLFVSNGPLRAEEIARKLEISQPEAESALNGLLERYAHGSGIRIIRTAGGYQMVTNPEFADYIARFLSLPPQKLSKAAMEALAIIAYRQPITSPEIDAVRGVDSSGVLHTLLERELIREVGRKDTPGRPILYATTEKFLEYFGLNDLSELPEIEEFSDPDQESSEPEPSNHAA